MEKLFQNNESNIHKIMLAFCQPDTYASPPNMKQSQYRPLMLS